MQLANQKYIHIIADKERKLETECFEIYLENIRSVDVDLVTFFKHNFVDKKLNYGQ